MIIPAAAARAMICVSSQVGCTRSRKFCSTATLGFGRNLRAAEIVTQYLIARMLAPVAKPATNVVFMGTGEPMDNLDKILVAVDVLTRAPRSRSSVPSHLDRALACVEPASERRWGHADAEGTV